MWIIDRQENISMVNMKCLLKSGRAAVSMVNMKCLLKSGGAAAP